MIEKVRILSVDIGDKIYDGKFGPQKLVKLKQALSEGERFITGFISVTRIDEFKPNTFMDLDVFPSKKDPKYWNFYLPSKKAQDQQKQTESTEKTMDALRKIYQKLLDIERRLPEASEEKKPLSVFDETLDDKLNEGL